MKSRNLLKINNMPQQRTQLYFFYVILLAVLGLLFLIFSPFLKILFLATVLAVVFYPLHKKFLAQFSFKGGKSLSAFLTVLVVLLLILIPFIGLSILIWREISNVYFDLVANSGHNSLLSFFTEAGSYVNGIFPQDVIPPIDAESIQTYASEGYAWAFNHFQALFSSAFNIIMSLFIMVLALFFFLRDGQKFKTFLLFLSPLNDADDEGIIEKIKQAMSSVIKGSLFIALVQGVLATIGFFIFGVPSAILWGAVAVFTAMIPFVGTALVILPAVLFLFFTKGIVFAAGLLIWGMVAVGTVDNLLAPFILKRGIKIHPFLILLSVLGGLSFFGPIGFLAGPVVLSLFFALVSIYLKVTNREESS